MQKIILPALISGLAIFLWVNISWMVLPWHKATIHKLENQTEIQELLARSVKDQKPAVYALPAMHEKIKHNGPSAMLAITPQPPKGFSPIKLLYEFLLDVFISAVIASLLLKTNLKTYGERFQFVLTAGLAIAAAAYVPNVIWWGFALDFAAVGIADSLCMSVVAALVLAKFVKI